MNVILSWNRFYFNRPFFCPCCGVIGFKTYSSIFVIFVCWCPNSTTGTEAVSRLIFFFYFMFKHSWHLKACEPTPPPPRRFHPKCWMQQQHFPLQFIYCPLSPHTVVIHRQCFKQWYTFLSSVETPSVKTHPVWQLFPAFLKENQSLK